MQRSGLSIFLGFIVLAALLAGCGVIADPPTPTPLPSPTQPPPTATPIPPTDTPVPTATPTPTATPLPSQTIEEIVPLLKPVVEGNGVPEAAEYDPDEPGIHPLVFISPIRQGVYDFSLPKTWIPQNIGQVELVAAIRFNNVLIQTRHYHVANTTIGRYRVDTEVSLREARTGNLIASTTFQGSDPSSFPKGERLPKGDLLGAAASADIILIWLKDYVEKQ